MATHLWQNIQLYSFGYDGSVPLESTWILRAAIWTRIIATCLYVWEKVEFRE